MQRKLTVIMSADMARYSGLMEADETGTLNRLKAHRANVFDPQFSTHGGRVFKLMGDGVLAEFPSVVAAVECAIAIQEAAEKAEVDQPEDKRIRYRIGIDLGEVILDGDDIYGNGVNIAARLQTVAPEGGIVLSRAVRDQVAGKASCSFDEIGELTLKNIERPVQAFRVRCGTDGEVNEVSPPIAEGVSICVLPFLNTSDDVQQEYFCDGMSDDIITDLTKVSALRVVARNTAFTYKGKSVEVPQVARHLKVSHVLEGSVRKVGDRVRILAQLVDGHTGNQVWAERFDRQLGDIFALQDEVSEAVVEALKVRLQPEEKIAIRQRGTDKPEAYNLFLMANHKYVSGDQGDPEWGEAIARLCRHATEIDPNYAAAWALQALGYLASNYTHGLGIERALEPVNRAIALNPALALAHTVKARFFLDSERPDKAIEEVNLALRLEPDSWYANYWAALIWYTQERWDNALPYFKKATELDRTDINSAAFLVAYYKHNHDNRALRHAAELLLDHIEQTLEKDQSNAQAISVGSVALFALGQDERARLWMDRALLINPDNHMVQYQAALIFAAYLKDDDKAFEMLGKAVPQMGPGFLRMGKTSLYFDSIRDQPRFKKLWSDAEERFAKPDPVATAN